jgi:hypothetical protein
MLAYVLVSLVFGCGGRADSPSPAAAHAVTEITLERNCFGCPAGSVFVLKRDGAATYTVTGSARQGTPDRTSTGRIGRDEFDTLARLMVSRGFFGMKNEYADPQLQDGDWSSLTARREGVEKKVFERNGAGPAELHAIQKAIDTLRGRLALTPGP